MEEKEDAEMAKQYWAEEDLSIPLPEISVLPRRDGFRRCEFCPKLYGSLKSLRVHVAKVHDEVELGKGYGESLPTVSVQRLCKGREHSRWFEVVLNQRPAEDLGTEGESIRKAFLAYSDRVYVANNGTRSNSRPDDRLESTFVSIAKPKDRLEAVGLSMDDAGYLLSTNVECGDKFDKGFIRFVEQSVLEFFGAAHELDAVGEMDMAFKLALSVPGTETKKRGFAWVTGKSLKRYAQCVKRLVLMCVRIVQNSAAYEKIRISEELALATADFISLSKAKSLLDGRIFHVHELLRHVMLVQKPVQEAPRTLFAYSFLACACVERDRSGKLRFRAGIQVSPEIAAILYSASCAAMLAVNKFSNKADREDVFNEVQKCFALRSSGAIGVFIDLRSICIVVREQEQARETFMSCEAHANCGFARGVELSCAQLGSAVKKMHVDLEAQILELAGVDVERAQNGAVFPKFVENGLNSLVDDTQNTTVGYSFMSEKRNIVFIRAVLRWVADQQVEVFKDKETAASWVTRARSALALFATIMHISAGAPGRGTEQSALLIRNTGSCVRGVFICGAEVFFEPAYFKQRGLHNWNFRPISRHLDEMSSRLFKLFSIIVLPLYETLAEAHGLKEKWEGIHPRTGLKQVMEVPAHTLFCCRELYVDFSGKVGSILTKYGIELTFQDFRHWQRGIAHRMKGAVADLDDHREMEDEVVAAIEQAGHAVRTSLGAYALTKSLHGVEHGTFDQTVNKYRWASQMWHTALGLGGEHKARGSSSMIRIATNRDIDRLENKLSKIMDKLTSFGAVLQAKDSAKSAGLWNARGGVHVGEAGKR